MSSTALGSTVAIDVVVLLPEATERQVVALNAELRRTAPASFALDDTHLPHITLVQQSTRVEDLDAALEAVAATLRARRSLRLRGPATNRLRTSAWLEVENTEELQELHVALAHALEPFAGAPVDASSFYVDGEEPRAADIDWVRNYHTASSHENFRPHVTLGIGAAPPLEQPLTFVADRIAVCRLGRHCTCREVVRDWRLGAG